MFFIILNVQSKHSEITYLKKKKIEALQSFESHLKEIWKIMATRRIFQFDFIFTKKCDNDGLEHHALLKEAHDLSWPFLCLPALPLSFQLLWDTPAEAKASTIHYWRNKSQSAGQSRADQLKPAPT